MPLQISRIKMAHKKIFAFTALLAVLAAPMAARATDSNVTLANNGAIDSSGLSSSIKIIPADNGSTVSPPPPLLTD